MREEHVCLDLFVSWLAEEHGRWFTVERAEEPAPNALVAKATDEDGSGLAVEVQTLLPPTENPDWLALREGLEEEIGRGLDGSYALWAPPGADLPGGDEQQRLVELARETLSRLEQGERSYVPIPVTLFLRKTQDDGSLFSVSGGLNAYWARLSEKARGTFDLDSTRLHRLPESEEHRERLFEELWQRASTLEANGEWEEIETVDAWTAQRLGSGEGVSIIGRPPGELTDVGLAVRKSFRKVLAEAAPRLRAREAGLRALVVLGFYGRVEEEGATTAMRGYDPSLYAGLDFVCLATDGRVKALMEARSGARG